MVVVRPLSTTSRSPRERLVRSCRTGTSVTPPHLCSAARLIGERQRMVKSLDAAYGNAVADDYDATYAGFDVSDAQLALLAALAGDGHALEIGVGTGRVAIPLARKGVTVTGVDPSQTMLDILRSKDVECLVATRCGTIETMEGGSAFTLVYAPFNVLFMLSRDGAQSNFFSQAASVLLPGGHVVVECFVPRPGSRLVDGSNPAFFPAARHIEVRSVTPDGISLLISDNDQTQQVWQFNEVILRSDHTMHMVPSTIAYLEPEQIDALAFRAGFQLVSRHSDWEGSAYTHEARKHVTVYAMSPDEETAPCQTTM